MASLFGISSLTFAKLFIILLEKRPQEKQLNVEVKDGNEFKDENEKV